MVFEKMLTMQGMMFFFVIIGFIVRKRRIVGTTGRLNMVDLCLYVLLPFNIFHAFLVQPHHDVWGPVVITILLSVLYNVISVASAFLLYKKTDEEKKKPLRYGTIVSNGGFLGNPVIENGLASVRSGFHASSAGGDVVGGRLLLPSGTEKERAEKGDHSPMYCRDLSGTDCDGAPSGMARFFPEWGGGLKQR